MGRMSGNRRIATFVISVLALIGWAAFVGGFAIREFPTNLPRTNPFWFSWWLLAGAGVLGNILFIINAISPNRIVGGIAIFLIFIEVVGSGHVLNYNGDIVRNSCQHLIETITSQNVTLSGNVKDIAGSAANALGNIASVSADCINALPTYVKLEFAGSFIYVLFQFIAFEIMYVGLIKATDQVMPFV